jgi:hypothetical protein
MRAPVQAGNMDGIAVESERAAGIESEL